MKATEFNRRRADLRDEALAYLISIIPPGGIEIDYEDDAGNQLNTIYPDKVTGDFTMTEYGIDELSLVEIIGIMYLIETN